MNFAKILLKIEKPDEAEEYFRVRQQAWLRSSNNFKRAFGIISIFYEPKSTVRKQLLDSIMEAYELAQVQEDTKKAAKTPAGPDGKPKLKNLFAELKANGQI